MLIQQSQEDTNIACDEPYTWNLSDVPRKEP